MKTFRAYPGFWESFRKVFRPLGHTIFIFCQHIYDGCPHFMVIFPCLSFTKFGWGKIALLVIPVTCIGSIRSMEFIEILFTGSKTFHWNDIEYSSIAKTQILRFTSHRKHRNFEFFDKSFSTDFSRFYVLKLQDWKTNKQKAKLRFQCFWPFII